MRGLDYNGLGEGFNGEGGGVNEGERGFKIVGGWGSIGLLAV